MAELTTLDVENFTNARLDSLDANVQLMLNAALIVARRQAGWHVSPAIEDDEIILDGPDSRILYLPTRKLNALTSIEEDGVDLDLATLRWSAGGPPGLLESPVRVRKRSKGWWSDEYQAITVVMDHGYTEAEAADWRLAILGMVDEMSRLLSSTSDFGLTRKTVDDVTYAWSDILSIAEGALYSAKCVLDDYKLPPVEFI